MTEAEFWQSTLAKVTAIYKVRLEWNKTRDYFPAQLSAITLNSMRTTGSKLFTTDELMAARYPIHVERVIITEHDPDHGALGDWRLLKDNLKGRKE